jgi:hypothetical protein
MEEGGNEDQGEEHELRGEEGEDEETHKLIRLCRS